MGGGHRRHEENRGRRAAVSRSPPVTRESGPHFPVLSAGASSALAVIGRRRLTPSRHLHLDVDALDPSLAAAGAAQLFRARQLALSYDKGGPSRLALRRRWLPAARDWAPWGTRELWLRSCVVPRRARLPCRRDSLPSGDEERWAKPRFRSPMGLCALPARWDSTTRMHASAHPPGRRLRVTPSPPHCSPQRATHWTGPFSGPHTHEDASGRRLLGWRDARPLREYLHPTTPFLSLLAPLPRRPAILASRISHSPFPFPHSLSSPPPTSSRCGKADDKAVVDRGILSFTDLLLSSSFIRRGTFSVLLFLTVKTGVRLKDLIFLPPIVFFFFFSSHRFDTHRQHVRPCSSTIDSIRPGADVAGPTSCERA